MTPHIEHIETETINASYGRLFQHENGIIYLYIKDDLSIDMDIAQQMVVDIRSLDNSGDAHLIIVQGHNNDASFEAQRFFSVTKGVTKLAMVSQSRIQAEVVKFFTPMLRLFRAPYELKAFYSLEQAERWLLDDCDD